MQGAVQEWAHHRPERMIDQALSALGDELVDDVSRAALGQQCNGIDHAVNIALLHHKCPRYRVPPDIACSCKNSMTAAFPTPLTNIVTLI